MDREPVFRLHAGRGRPVHCAAQDGSSAVAGAGAIDGRARTADDRKLRAPPAAGPRVASIAAMEKRMMSLTDEELQDRTAALRARLSEEAKEGG